MERFKNVTIEVNGKSGIASGLTNERWFYISTTDNIVAFLKYNYYELPDTEDIESIIVKKLKGKEKSLFISEFLFNMQYEKIDNSILNIFRDM